MNGNKKITELEEVLSLLDNAYIPLVQGNPIDDYKISKENLINSILVGGSAHIIQGDGVTKEKRSKLNFIGANVVDNINNDSTDITGLKGDKGEKGDAGIGEKGNDGVDGTNGITPHIGINGNWYIDTTDTGIHAQGNNGSNGINGSTPYIQSNYWYINGTSTGILALGQNGNNGTNGRGITSIELISTVGLIKTYRINYSDSTTFTYIINDGTNGSNGKTAYQSAQDGGYIGSESQFNIDLKDISNKLNINQSIPQTIINGVPKLSSDRVINNDNQLVDKYYVDNMTMGGYRSNYFTKTPSDVIGTNIYKSQTIYPTGLPQEITVSVSSVEEIIGSFIEDVNVTPYRVLQGIRFFHLIGRVQSDAHPVQLRGYIYTCDISGGTRTLLRTSTLSTPLTLVNAEYSMSVYGTDLVIPTTTRIMFVITAIKTGGSNTTNVTITVDDNTFSRLDVPSSVGVTDISGKEDKINKKTTLTNSDIDYPTTKAVNTGLSLKSDTGHTHSQYLTSYTETNPGVYTSGQTDTLLNSKSNLSGGNTFTGNQVVNSGYINTGQFVNIQQTTTNVSGSTPFDVSLGVLTVTTQITGNITFNITNQVAGGKNFIYLQQGLTAYSVILSCTGVTFKFLGATGSTTNTITVSGLTTVSRNSCVELNWVSTTTCYVSIK